MLDKRLTRIKKLSHLSLVTLFVIVLSTQLSWANEPSTPYHPPVFGSKARIVSLAPAATETLFYIGAGEQIVGRTNACDFPAEALKVPHIGSLFPPNLEAILRLKPDLVVMAAGSDALRKDLRKWGVYIHTYQPNNLKDIGVQMRVLGHLTNRNPTTETRALSFETALNQLRIKPTTSSPRVYWEIWTQPMMTVGGPSFVNDLIQWAGGHNIFAHLDTAYPKVTGEAVVRASPNMVFSTNNLRTQIDTKPWLKLLTLKPEKIVQIKTPDIVHRPTPRVLEGIKWLTAALGHN